MAYRKTRRRRVMRSRKRSRRRTRSVRPLRIGTRF